MTDTEEPRARRARPEPEGGPEQPRARRARISRGWIWWLALVAPLWLVFALCAHWEPVIHDGWAAAKWHFFNDVSWRGVVDYQVAGWQLSNPRLGQTLTLLLFTPGPYHAIVTPVVELGMFLLLTTLALGRAPSVRRADDALVALTIIAIVALCTPQLGPMLFYRPFTGNYLFGFVLNLIWLVPYRLHLERLRPGGANPPDRGHRPALAAALLVLGVAAGACNEHTGLAVLALAGLAVYQAIRWGGRIRIWMITGLVGLAAGYAVLLLAPGQGLRYNNLAQQAGILGRIAERGVGGNLATLAKLALYMLPAVPWLALGVVARRRRGGPVPMPSGRVLAALALAGVACAVTLLASPKLGPRLYLASVALIATALAAWVCGQLRAAGAPSATAVRGPRIACAVLAAGVVAYVAVRCVTTYHAVASIGADRLRKIHASAATGVVVVVERYPVGKSKYFFGDDFASVSLRDNLAADYGLRAIELAP